MSARWGVFFFQSRAKRRKKRTTRRQRGTTEGEGEGLGQVLGFDRRTLYRKLEPTGYSNLNAEWVNSASLLGRMNFALQLAQSHVESVKVDVSRFGDDPNQVAKALMFRAYETLRMRLRSLQTTAGSAGF